MGIPEQTDQIVFRGSEESALEIDHDPFCFLDAGSAVEVGCLEVPVGQSKGPFPTMRGDLFEGLAQSLSLLRSCGSPLDPRKTPVEPLLCLAGYELKVPFSTKSLYPMARRRSKLLHSGNQAAGVGIEPGTFGRTASEGHLLQTVVAQILQDLNAIGVGMTARHGESGLFKESADGFQVGLVSGEVLSWALWLDAGDEAFVRDSVFKVQAEEEPMSQSRFDGLDPAWSPAQEVCDFCAQLC